MVQVRTVPKVLSQSFVRRGTPESTFRIVYDPTPESRRDLGYFQFMTPHISQPIGFIVDPTVSTVYH